MTDTCVHVGCDRPQRARTLCQMHYQQLKRSGLPTYIRKQPRQAKGLQLDCQLGRNRSCVDCGDEPFGGGMRCLTCFQKRCDERQGTHMSDREPGVSAYTDGCRCRRCTIAASKARKEQRHRKAAA